MNISPLAQCDFYKTGHYKMYPSGMTRLVSNFTPRKSRIKGVDKVVVFGLQYFIIEYLIKQWNEEFFQNPNVVEEYKFLMDYTLGKDAVTVEHIEKLHKLQYLPLRIKALPEGVECPIGVPVFVIENTHEDFGWLVNYLETIISATIWQPMTSATIAFNYKRLLSKYALETTGSTDFVQWQGHDFAMRGMSSLESACTSGAGHLLSFTGTDTIPSISFLMKYYGADITKELIGSSVPATEHSVMCMGGKEDEIETFERLLDLYPNGILSVVSDTWDLWKVCTEFLPALKDKILTRNGKLVIRPDSGDPVDIICGKRYDITEGPLRDRTNEEIGVIELLWKVFGGRINEKGYKELDPHIGAIYGDSITLDRAEQICERLKAKGFASTNVVLGIGSYTYQYNTRDTFGFAMKATYGEVIIQKMSGKSIDRREIWKDPITDDGTKKSAKGLIRVNEILQPDTYGNLQHITYKLKDQCTEEEYNGGALQVVFEDGILIKFQTLSEIRERLNKNLWIKK